MEIERTEYDARQAAARKLARERGFSALVAWSRGGSTQDHYADVYYLTGFYTHQPFIPDEPGRWRAHGHTALVLPLDEPGTLLLDMTELQDPKPAADRVRFAENLVESLPGRSGLMRSHTSSVSSPRPATAVCLPVIHTEQEKNLPAVAVIHQTGPSTGPVRGACDSLHFAVRRHSSEERGMPESEKRSFWDRLFNTADRSSEREARVLEYIMHRVGEGAHLSNVVNEEYVRRNASREEVEEICARPELVQMAREHLQQDFGSGELDPTWGPK